MNYLELKQVSRSFGGLMAVSNVSLSVKKHSLTGLIGPNGAGKTTLFNVLTGVYPLSSGEIILNNQQGPINIGKKKPYQVAALGLARTFQNIRLFKDLTVLDNVRIAMHPQAGYGLLSALGRLPKFFSTEHVIEKRALELLALVKLDNYAYELAKNLPYGKQRELEIVRALATGSDILFLDEPAAGMNQRETEDLTHFIGFIRQQFNLTIVLIEHDMSLVMKLCEMIYVLDYGKLIAAGTPTEIKTNQRVIEAYLGDDHG